MKSTLIIAARPGDGSALARLLMANGQLTGSDIDIASDASKAIMQFDKNQYRAVVLTYDTNAGAQLEILTLQIKGLRIMFPQARLIVRGPYDFSQELKADGYLSTRDDHMIVPYLAQVLTKKR